MMLNKRGFSETEITSVGFQRRWISPRRGGGMGPARGGGGMGFRRRTRGNGITKAISSEGGCGRCGGK